ncbi:hypothetical protein A5888_000829 [Enterococcus sp. 9E7_DIV0242]|uniref:Uncharacterized protein n=1 Tax=Candidatus Enterococcus clewellii TaxID=1834193 RepID=A0A242JWX3_9ENTE|nr:hypothetical protein A5888_004173 [Enterococcus sp. 9E7_DIV0242]
MSVAYNEPENLFYTLIKRQPALIMGGWSDIPKGLTTSICPLFFYS